jgi:hypothetical protein
MAFISWEKLENLIRSYLVGGLEHGFYFPYIGNFSIPTDELHHFSEGVVYH